jgi:hypothetical protein
MRTVLDITLFLLSFLMRAIKSSLMPIADSMAPCMSESFMRDITYIVPEQDLFMKSDAGAGNSESSLNWLIRTLSAAYLRLLWNSLSSSTVADE